MKNQVTVNATNEGGQSFASFDDVRSPGDTDNDCDEYEPNIDETQTGFVNGFGGDTDVSGGVNTTSLNQGYAVKNLKSTMSPNDMLMNGTYEGELADSGGFADRNNYMDRM